MKGVFRKKIIELFEYRKLPEIIALGNSGMPDYDLYEKLIMLQYHIYLLDEILESNWKVSMVEIDKSWVAIHNDLRELGIDKNKIDQYCKHIYKYQRHELELRENKLPNRLSMEYFYFYKSCDVKLLRKIIYDKYPLLKKENKLSDWRVFDLITEINDDVEDVYEDLETINGNRFLLGILLAGSAKTEERYSNYLKSLESRIGNSNSTIDAMTREAYVETKKLLRETVDTLDEDKIMTGIIVDKLSQVFDNTES